MKKTFLKFPKQPKSYLPKITSRRIGLHSFINIAYKSDGSETKEETETDEVKAIQKIGDQVTEFSKLLGDKADKAQFDSLQKEISDLSANIKKMQADEITKSIESINEANAKIVKQILELQEEQAKSKENSDGKKKVNGVTIDTKEVQKFIDATFKDGKKTHEAATITIKAAETMGTATFYEGGADTVTDAFTGRFVDPTLYQRRRKKNLILDNFMIGNIGVPKILFLVKVEEGDSNSVSLDPGGADWILSSEAKPKRSFRVTTGEAEAKKVAIFSTVEDKLLKDVASLERWLREDLMDEMREKINDGLLNNDTGSNPKAPQGLKQEAIQFTATSAWSGSTTDPNYIDDILAIKAMFSHNKETLDSVFVSSSVITKIMGLKDADGKYQNNNLVYINSVGTLFIGGIPVLEADDEDVPDTHVLAIGAELGFKIYAYGPLAFERGLNGEDFRYDRTSYRAYQEFITYLPTHRENSVMYDTWANIEADILAGS